MMSLDFDPDLVEVPVGHHIDGAFIDLPGEEIAVYRPSDHQLMGVLHDGGTEAVDRAVLAARGALARSRWAHANPRERARVLHAFADAVEAHATPLGQLEAAGSTRLISLTTPRDIIRTAGVIRYYAEYCDKLEGSITSTDAASLSLVRHEPYGIVGAIVPWNFPAITAAWKFAPALAAGNAVVMKTSELTPHSLLALAEIATTAGLPAGLLNIVNGYGRSTGSAIVAHPDIAKISFTGSTATGADIMALAAHAGIKPLTLELGGKSPQIVFADHGEINETAARIAAGFCDNAGQVCTSGARLIVESRIADSLLSRIENYCAKLAAGPTWSTATTLAPIINARQTARIEHLLHQTLAQGATLRIGGSRVETYYKGCYFAPTILEGVTRDMAGFKDEFFGPVLTVDRFDTEEQAHALANHPTYGLAASVHTRDLSKALRAVDALEAGMIWVNQHGRAPEFTFPAGGFRRSGFGKDMGRAGLEEFHRQKAVWINYAQ